MLQTSGSKRFLSVTVKDVAHEPRKISLTDQILKTLDPEIFKYNQKFRDLKKF
jgi:hypothetical protein